MTRSCLVCGASAEASIPAGRVCRLHAIEFYTGLVAFAVDRDRELVVPHLLPDCLTAAPPRRSYIKRSAYWRTTQRIGLAAAV